MPSIPQETFLTGEVPKEVQWQALHQNNQLYRQRRVQATATGRVGTLGDLTWTGTRFWIKSGADLEDDQVIDCILSWYRNQVPAQGALWIYAGYETPSTLGPRLLARGFAPQHEWLWMWAELRKSSEVHLADESIVIRLATPDDYLLSSDGDEESLQNLSQAKPRRVFHFVAVRGLERVGKCLVNITTGELGISSIFDMAVSPKERKKGIGAALLQVAHNLCIERGCRYMVLNATQMGEPLYRRFGFKDIGSRPAFFLSTWTIAQKSPTELQVRVLEAVGLGDVEKLEELRPRLSQKQLQEATLNELTPFEIAAHFHQRRAAAWLLQQGVTADPISLWDLGWKEKLPELLSEHPELAKEDSSLWSATPLHVAIERNDAELATILLTVPHDLDARDGHHRLTPSELAHHLKRKEILALLEENTGIDASQSTREQIHEILGGKSLQK